MHEIRRHQSGADLFAAVGRMLTRHECENSLLMGLAGSDKPFEGCELAMSVWTGSSPTAALAQTSIREAVLSLANEPAARAIGLAFAEADPGSRGIVGPSDASTPAAEAFAERTGAHRRLERRLLLSRLATDPDPGPGAGSLRAATPADAGLLIGWVKGFDEDTRSPEHARDPVRRVTHATDAGRLFVLEEEGQPVAAACWSRETGSTCTINLVYTPPEQRGRGRARTATSQLAARLRAMGTRDVLIFTDADDPTPNRVYTRVGFQPLAEFTHWAFDPQSEPRA